MRASALAVPDALDCDDVVCVVVWVVVDAVDVV
jgi:hypothetical protein